MKKKITFLLLMIFASTNIYSQNYTISFDASGAATTLDSVRIINLTHPDTAMWHDGDIFQLQLNNAINDIETNKENLLIFPNPMQGKAEIMFNVKQTGIASIKIYEITGKEIIHLDENLSQGNHQFQLSGLKQGAYFINIRGNGYFYSSKLISYNSFSNDINLKYNGVIQETNTNKYKTSNSSINFSFVSGDMLQFTGYSANLTDVFTYSPTSDITITFSFIASIPSITTDAATTITTNSAISGGNVTSDGGEIVTARGICYATTANPTITDNIVASGSGTGLFTANLTGLTPGTTYYVRAYATNSVGTAYGNEMSFVTIPVSLPVLTTTNASSITNATAITGGNISSDGGAFISVRGVCWSTVPNPHIGLNTKTINGIGTGNYISNITGLIPDTIYYVRAYATNSAGTAYGNEIIFSTLPTTQAILTTAIISSITNLTAISGGFISSDGGAVVIERGICWSTSPNPTIALTTKTNNGTGIGSFASNISNLVAGTTYFVRAYATNSIGTAYGNEINFTTLLQDRDSNIYDIVTIGNQVWMKQNLKTTHYKNGTTINFPGTNNSAWVNTTSGAYAWYDNDSVTYKNIYGGLYNWYAVNTGNLCPTGWHVPTIAEWDTLTVYLGGASIAGGKLKSTTLWSSPNSGATNSSGYTALPGGRRYSESGATSGISYVGFWWSSSQYNTNYSYATTMEYVNSILVYDNINKKQNGYSVRCLRDMSAQIILPTIITTTANNITTSTAIAGGNIIIDGNAAITARGICWSNSPNPTIADSIVSGGTGSGIFTSSIIGLTAGTTYFVRAFATNSIGTAYGNEINFTTIPSNLAVLTTTNVSSISYTTAITGGNISSYGAGTIFARGVCWSTSSNPTIALNTKTSDGTGTGSFTSNIIGLTPGTTYYMRAYATNSVGTAYGNEIIFTTLTNPLNTVYDYDGNIYDTIHIGTQIWLKQNLRTTHYKNGTYIPNVINSEIWEQLNSGARCYYYDDSAYYASSRGGLYNWYAVNTTNLCPTGWHVPNNVEWLDLSTYLGGDSVAGGKLKETGNYVAGTSLWLPSNSGATNSSGFTAQPVGTRKVYGDYELWGEYCKLWSSYTYNNYYFHFEMKYSNPFAFLSNCTLKNEGLPVRCIKDIGTQATLPVITTINVSNIDSANAISGGNISYDGGVIVTSRGVCWSTTPNPTINLSTKTIDGTGVGNFVSNISNLTANTTYYIRAYATTSIGTTYGNQYIFTTDVTVLPTLTSKPITSITSTTANSGGNIISDGGTAVTARGVCWSTTSNPTVPLSTKTSDGTGVGSFISNITGLSAGTTYFLRAYATNNFGTAYGNEINFTCPTTLPSLTTTAATNITATTVNLGGNIISNGGATVTAHGVCWRTSANPTIADNKTNNGTGIGSFVSSIVGLAATTTYYVRAYATNSVGTAYGNEISFTTLIPPIGTVIDYDGNVYDTVQIGTQVWMKQNLKTTHYKNGASINYPGTNNTAWQNNTSGAYAWYNNDSVTYKNTYGALYNWYAVNTGNLCPTGWHVPTAAEWDTLTIYLGGENIAGVKLKEAGFSHWITPNYGTTGATNETGFTALPGGYRNNNLYSGIGLAGLWWSSSVWGSMNNANYLGMNNSSGIAGIFLSEKIAGLSVRCLKD